MTMGDALHVVVPYIKLARLHILAGPSLVWWPCAWALTLVAISTGMPTIILIKMLSLFFIGSFTLHSAECVWNDICDVDFDRKVERTKNRPLAAGQISLQAAGLFLLPQVCLCLGLLLLTSAETIYVGLFGLFFLDTLYPLMKRVTYWPQAWLGIAINWGIPVAGLAATDRPDWRMLGALLVGAWCWTLHYDTCYAFQDKKDDVDAGVKSTALLFGQWGRPFLLFFSVGFITSLWSATRLANMGMLGTFLSIGGAAFHLLWQLLTIDPENPMSCGSVFKSNGEQLGWIVWSGMLLDYQLKQFA
ncbi:UbiA prenyltransferase [Sistotremastrum niveocremeum HHB9708]|uniref:4-hydroxybenzoate polyprenyltransferase, mitochondrial n=1 Tax=Sistotremastrum niveocremeum HHB9708 TaxID=1314777 RepID=A0A164T776_9AGAM|nr:UbiA prenyltransferase [Sistotremastrum niveocremeum HHB9708]